MKAIKDTTGGLVIANDTDSIQDAKLAESYAKTIGSILHRTYPQVLWHVSVNIAMGQAGIRIPAVSMKHGMSVHLSRNVHELERRCKGAAGEMLERFGISRETGDTSHLAEHKNIKGEVRSASAGELLPDWDWRRNRHGKVIH